MYSFQVAISSFYDKQVPKLFGSNYICVHPSRGKRPLRKPQMKCGIKFECITSKFDVGIVRVKEVKLFLVNLLVK